MSKVRNAERASRGGKAVVPTAGRRVAGLHASTGYWMSADFDAPLPKSFWTGAKLRRRGRRTR